MKITRQHGPKPTQNAFSTGIHVGLLTVLAGLTGCGAEEGETPDDGTGAETGQADGPSEGSEGNPAVASSGGSDSDWENNLPDSPPGNESADGGKTVSAAPGGQPYLECEVRDHEFGEAYEGEILTHVFTLRNSGDQPLTISQAKPSCGCTVGHVRVRGDDGEWNDYKFNDPIPAGADFELEANLDTKGKTNTAASKINVHCNDPREVVPLGVSAQVRPYFRVAPPSLNFGSMSVADSASQSLEILSRRPGSFALSIEDENPTQGVSLQLTPVEPGDDGRAERWRVDVTVGPDCREGPLGYRLELKSDQEIEGAPPQADGTATVYTTSVQINARVEGLISLDRPYLSFGPLRSGQVASRSLRIQNNDPNFEMGIPEVRLEDMAEPGKPSAYAEYFSTSVRPIDAQGKIIEVELTLQGLPESITGSVIGSLVVEVGHPSHPEVRSQFNGVVIKSVSTQNRQGPNRNNNPANAGGR